MKWKGGESFANYIHRNLEFWLLCFHPNLLVALLIEIPSSQYPPAKHKKLGYIRKNHPYVEIYEALISWWLAGFFSESPLHCYCSYRTTLNPEILRSNNICWQRNWISWKLYTVVPKRFGLNSFLIMSEIIGVTKNSLIPNKNANFIVKFYHLQAARSKRSDWHKYRIISEVMKQPSNNEKNKKKHKGKHNLFHDILIS